MESAISFLNSQAFPWIIFAVCQLLTFYDENNHLYFSDKVNGRKYYLIRDGKSYLMGLILCIFKGNIWVLIQRQVRERRIVVQIDFYFLDIFDDIFPESRRRSREVAAEFNILKIRIHLQLLFDDNNLIIIKLREKKIDTKLSLRKNYHKNLVLVKETISLLTYREIAGRFSI